MVFVTSCHADASYLPCLQTAVDWGQGLSRDGANFFLLKCLSQKQVASIFNSLTGQNVPSDATGQSQDCLANAKQCTDVANGPYALVMAFTISILSNAVQRYRAEYRKGASDKAAMPEEDGKDSQQKGQADKLDRLDKCRLQCELVLMWRKYGVGAACKRDLAADHTCVRTCSETHSIISLRSVWC